MPMTKVFHDFSPSYGWRYRHPRFYGSASTLSASKGSVPQEGGVYSPSGLSASHEIGTSGSSTVGTVCTYSSYAQAKIAYRQYYRLAGEAQAAGNRPAFRYYTRKWRCARNEMIRLGASSYGAYGNEEGGGLISPSLLRAGVGSAGVGMISLIGAVWTFGVGPWAVQQFKPDWDYGKRLVASLLAGAAIGIASAAVSPETIEVEGA